MKNKEIIKLYEGLNQIKDIKFKPKTSFILAKNKIALEPLYMAAMKCQQDVIEQFGVIQDDGAIQVPRDKIKDVNKSLTELMEVENEIKLDKLKIEEFGEETLDMDILEKLINIIEE